MRDPIEQFRDAISSAGLIPPDVIEADGKLRRFASSGKARDDAGWYVFYGDGVPAGVFGDWRNGFTHTWRVDIGRRLSPKELAASFDRIAAIKRQRDCETLRLHRTAQCEVRELWKTAQPADPAHPYLVSKAILPNDLRQQGRLLLVPLCDLSGALWNIQTISQDGRKLFQRGGRTTGLCSIIGAVNENPARLLICEGWATGATLHAETGTSVLCGMSAHNLKPLALAARNRWPNADLIVCGDNDRKTAGNPGATSARRAAEAVAGRLALPQFRDDEPGSDFNDLALLRMGCAV